MSHAYTLMCKDVPVCELAYEPEVDMVREVMKALNPEWCPPVALDGSRIDARFLEYWGMGRLVPAGRLPRYLQQRPGFAQLFADNRGLSLSDQYWIRCDDEGDVLWGDINFFDNPFNEEVGKDLLGTCGRSSLRQGERMDNPSFWSNGMLRKYWRIAPNGTRQLCKASSPARRREALDEHAVSEALALLFDDGFVRYALGDNEHGPWSVCACFTDASHEFVPMAGAFYGDTLTYEGMAPIFDCGTSLWCDPDAPLFASFAENLNFQADLIGDAPWVDWRTVDEAVSRAVEVLAGHGLPTPEVEGVAKHLQAQVDVLQDAL